MVKMIRNYQRSGGGSVNLAPVYSSLNALQNEINSLITVTDLSTLSSIVIDVNGLADSINTLLTAFTSHTYLNDYRSRTYTAAVGESFNSLSSSIMDINASISTLSNPTSLAILISQETASLESLVTDSLSTLSTSITSLLDWRLSTMSTSLTNRINEFATEIVTMDDVVSTLRSITSLSSLSSLTSLTSLTAGAKMIINPTERSHLFTDPVLYSGPNTGSFAFQIMKPSNNTYMKGVTWVDIFFTTLSNNNQISGAGMTNCLVYGDLVCIDAYSAQFSKVTASNAIFKNNKQITLSSCDIGKIDWLDGASSPAIVNKCTIDALGITGTGTEPANDANALRFNSNSIKYMHMLHSNGQAIMSDNTVEYGTFNVHNYENRGTGYAKHIDVTAAYVNILNDMRADKINVYCTEKLYCINNTLPYMNVSFYITDVNTHNTFPFMIESCSISHGVFYCDIPSSASVNLGNFELNSCTFETLSMDCYYASLANIGINNVADLKIGSAELKSNTCNGIMAGMFSVLSMSDNSLTVGEIYYMSSSGSSNTISMAGHLR